MERDGHELEMSEKLMVALYELLGTMILVATIVLTALNPL